MRQTLALMHVSSWSSVQYLLSALIGHFTSSQLRIGGQDGCSAKLRRQKAEQGTGNREQGTGLGQVDTLVF
jgi:hypothetical protein